jgi:hypothetical protein
MMNKKYTILGLVIGAIAAFAAIGALIVPFFVEPVQVNIGLKNDRHIDSQFKIELSTHLPAKDKAISINAVAGDPEAAGFAKEIWAYLKNEGYSVGAVNSFSFHPPVIGHVFALRSDGGLDIGIGTNN